MTRFRRPGISCNNEIDTAERNIIWPTVQILTSHMQFPADVPELQTQPLATTHRQAMNRRFPGDTVGSNTEKGKRLILTKR